MLEELLKAKHELERIYVDYDVTNVDAQINVLTRTLDIVLKALIEREETTLLSGL